MAICDHDPLSIWELGLRWSGIDPDKNNSDQLSAECRDLLRDLCLAGLRNINPFDADGDEYTGIFVPFINLDIESKVLKALETAVTTRRYDRELLDSIFFRKDQVASWCTNKRRALPFFWCRGDEADFYMSEWRKQWREEYPFEIPWLISAESVVSVTAVATSAPRRSTQVQRDRASVQVAAKTLWGQFPEMTIADLIKRKEIRIDNNGAQYEPKTLRAWVSKVDVRTLAVKTGRPKKKQ